MTKPNVRLFSEIFYDELDKAAWLFIDPDYFEEIADECPDGLEFLGEVPAAEDSEALAHIIYRALKRYEEAQSPCKTCDNWSY